MNILKEIHTDIGSIRITEYSRELTGRIIEMYESLDESVLDFGIPPYNEEKVRRMLSIHGKDGRVFVALNTKDKVVGQLLVHRFTDSRRNHICDFFVYIHQDYHNKGIGTELIRIMINWAEKQGVMKIKLGVFEDNHRAIHLYEKFGFREESRFRKELYRNGDYFDEIFMSRWLRTI
ncbi:MAG: GNAT family N-acetyltransferase [Candidatus Hodarchaeales archaeon]